jgi:hypothetical protein
MAAADWKVRGGEYNAESARVYGWRLAPASRYTGTGDPMLCPPISDEQARLLGLAAADGRIGPDTLRAFMREQTRARGASQSSFLDAFDFSTVNLDRPDPVRPGADKGGKGGKGLNPPDPKLPDPKLPAEPAPRKSSAGYVAAAVLVAAGAWYYFKGRR